MLIFNTTVLIGAIATLSLLLSFILVMIYNLAKARKPDCHCFGELHSTPISSSTVVRNGTLGECLKRWAHEVHKLCFVIREALFLELPAVEAEDEQA
jgi:hypothetical protein